MPLVTAEKVINSLIISHVEMYEGEWGTGGKWYEIENNYLKYLPEVELALDFLGMTWQEFVDQNKPQETTQNKTD